MPGEAQLGRTTDTDGAIARSQDFITLYSFHLGMSARLRNFRDQPRPQCRLHGVLGDTCLVRLAGDGRKYGVRVHWLRVGIS